MKLDYETIKYIIDQLDKETLYMIKEAIFEQEQEKIEENKKFSDVNVLWQNIKK